MVRHLMSFTTASGFLHILDRSIILRHSTRRITQCISPMDIPHTLPLRSIHIFHQPLTVGHMRHHMFPTAGLLRLCISPMEG